MILNHAVELLDEWAMNPSKQFWVYALFGSLFDLILFFFFWLIQELEVTPTYWSHFGGQAWSQVKHYYFLPFFPFSAIYWCEVE